MKAIKNPAIVGQSPHTEVRTKSMRSGGTYIFRQSLILQCEPMHRKASSAQVLQTTCTGCVSWVGRCPKCHCRVYGDRPLLCAAAIICYVGVACMGSVLVINSGSSSLKFKLFTSAAQKLSAAVTGLVERIGDTANSQLIVSNQKSEPQGGKQTFQVRIRVSAIARASHLAHWPPLLSVHSSSACK